LIIANGTLSGRAEAGITKSGSGPLNLNGTDTYTGPTTVLDGLLRLGGGTLQGPVTLSAAQGTFPIIQGHGTVASLSSMGGTIEPLPSIGVYGNVALDSASSFSEAISNNQPGGFQQLHVIGNGTVNLGIATLDIGINSNFSSAIGDAFTIVQNDPGNPITGNFRLTDGTVLTPGTFFSRNGVGFRIGYVSNSVVLTHVPPAFRHRTITSPINEGNVAIVTGTVLDPVTTDKFFLEATWGDGSPTQTYTFAPTAGRVSVSHRYLGDNPSGTPFVHLFWHNQLGQGNSSDLPVIVNNVPPTVQAGGDGKVLQGATFTRSGFFTDPGKFDTWTATVDYGDGSGLQPLALDSAHHFTLQHQYEQPGAFQVSVHVEDDDTGVGTAGFEVSVLPNGAALGTSLIDELFTSSMSEFVLVPGAGSPLRSQAPLEYSPLHPGLQTPFGIPHLDPGFQTPLGHQLSESPSRGSKQSFGNTYVHHFEDIFSNELGTHDDK
jgi:autotransporter-associated beta strand protein